MRKRKNRVAEEVQEYEKKEQAGKFHVEFLSATQKIAWSAFNQHDVLFLSGTAGTGKTFLAVAFAVNEILQKRKSRIILTRPIVEAGESLGFLPGSVEEKTDPYMMPMYDTLRKLVGVNGPQRMIIDKAIEVRPLAFMRGATFDDAICIFDEAQNATMAQLKLFLTRMGKNSKVIINGDPQQSDLKSDKVALIDCMHRLESLNGVGIIRFKADSIVRHSLIGKILEKLEE